MSVWAVTLSVCSGFISSISLLGFPAEVYYFGAIVLWLMAAYCIAFPMVAFLFLPVFYKLRLQSIYEVVLIFNEYSLSFSTWSWDSLDHAVFSDWPCFLLRWAYDHIGPAGRIGYRRNSVLDRIVHFRSSFCSITSRYICYWHSSTFLHFLHCLYICHIYQCGELLPPSLTKRMNRVEHGLGCTQVQFRWPWYLLLFWQ